jgi:hypothetical protein
VLLLVRSERLKRVDRVLAGSRITNERRALIGSALSAEQQARGAK